MHITGLRRLRGVDIAVRIKPDNSKIFFLFAIVIGHSGNAANCQRMVSTESDSNGAGIQGFFHGVGHVEANLTDLGHAACLIGAFFPPAECLGYRDVNFAHNLVTKSFDLANDAGYFHRRRSHAGSGVRSTEVQRAVDECNRPYSLHFRDLLASHAGGGDRG